METNEATLFQVCIQQPGKETITSRKFYTLDRPAWERQLGPENTARIIDNNEYVTLRNGVTLWLHSSQTTHTTTR